MRNTVAIAKELAPKGHLRVALNHGNVVLVRRRATDGEAEGITVDLAHKLATTLELPLKFVHFDRAGEVTDSAGTDTWDACFLAIDPLRAGQIAFTEPYIVIEGCYLVPQASPATTAADVDRLALRIGVVEGSAYALHLTRNTQGARIIGFPQFSEAAAALLAGHLDGLAGVRQAMEQQASRAQGCRLLEPSFMSIRQAMGVPAERPLAADFLRAFVTEMRVSGFVRDSAKRHAIEGVTLP